jgi:DhnA family fructose-bisphosphate aldolase class Ia
MPLGLAEAERVTETEEEAGRIEDVIDGVEVIEEVIEEVMEGVCDTVAVTDGV